MKPRLLDLFCGAGGAAVGYARSGYDVIGVDWEPQPDYPYEFHRLDATALRIDVVNDCLHEYGPDSALPGRSDVCLGRFDVIHASSPCQASCSLTKGTNKGRVHTQLIPATRRLMAEWRAQTPGLVTVLENVQGSDLRRDLTLCGEMFGLDVIRHRYFEIDGATVEQPAHVPHRGRVRGWRHGTYYDGPYVAVYGDGGGKGSVEEWQVAMGIDWTDSRHSLAEAIPPAYTEHIGAQLIAHLAERAA